MIHASYCFYPKPHIEEIERNKRTLNDKKGAIVFFFKIGKITLYFVANSLYFVHAILPKPHLRYYLSYKYKRENQKNTQC